MQLIKNQHPPLRSDIKWMDIFLKQNCSCATHCLVFAWTPSLCRSCGDLLIFAIFHVDKKAHKKMSLQMAFLTQFITSYFKYCFNEILMYLVSFSSSTILLWLSKTFLWWELHVYNSLVTWFFYDFTLFIKPMCELIVLQLWPCICFWSCKDIERLSSNLQKI